MVDGCHICVRISCHHRKGAFAPDATDEDHLLSRNTEFILTLDGLSSFGRGVGFLSVRLEEGRNGKNAASVLYGLLPGRFCGTFDAHVEHDSWFPGFLKSPRKLPYSQRSWCESWCRRSGVELGHDEGSNRFWISFRRSNRPVWVEVQRSSNLELHHDVEHFVVSEYDASFTHGSIVSANVRKLHV